MKKILVTYVEAGMGHITTARAVQDILEKYKDEEVEVIGMNLFHNHPKLEKFEKFLVNEVKKASTNPLHSRSQFIAMHIIGSQNSLKFVNGFLVFKKQRDLYIEELKKINPDIIIDTHYFCSYASITYRNKFKPDCKVVTYDPDNNVHGWWDIRADYFIVNNEYAYNEALKRGFKKEQVKQVFFITRQAVVDTNESKEFYREKYGIPQNKFAVKLADGVYAKAKLKSFVYELIKSDREMTIVAIAGKNKALYEELMALKPTLPKNINLMPFEFMPAVYEINKACDLFITKGGPNAVLDSVFMQTPVVINYYANAVEATTKKLFVDTLHCGVEIKDKKKAREFVEKCIDNPDILKPYVENEKKLDKNKNGAQEVAEFVLDIAKGKK
ncbi:MAG: hypothetical protein IJX25_03880 [Clostridia bacterium]|nr:hypothetical protein [Clostridia bacterium]